MPTVLLTGFPGFLGSALVKHLLKRYPDDTTITCLVQPKFRSLAVARAAVIEQEQAGWSGRLRLYDGDITQPDLGLGSRGREVQQETVEVYHLAAVYDLAVSREVGLNVNVNGTVNVLRFAEACPNLRRFQYVSTCYVSGRYDGVFGEDDLSVGQPFNNYYEETKYLAEVEVQRRMKAGLPATIYRPTIVVGDSRSGETQKYDGPYYIIQWILRWRGIAPVPVVGDPRRFTVNVVPRDFVVDALAYLSGIEASNGKVYQLCDPRPLTVREMLDALARTTGRTLLHIPLPLALAKAALRHIPWLYRWLRIEPEAVDYFVHPTRYRCEHTLRDLEGTSIRCPSFETYVPHLIAYMRAHPEVTSAAMA